MRRFQCLPPECPPLILIKEKKKSKLKNTVKTRTENEFWECFSFLFVFENWGRGVFIVEWRSSRVFSSFLSEFRKRKLVFVKFSLTFRSIFRGSRLFFSWLFIFFAYNFKLFVEECTRHARFDWWSLKTPPVPRWQYHCFIDSHSNK